MKSPEYNLHSLSPDSISYSMVCFIRSETNRVETFHFVNLPFKGVLLNFEHDWGVRCNTVQWASELGIRYETRCSGRVSGLDVTGR